MRTSYELATKYINTSLSDKYIKENEGSDKPVISIGSSVVVHDLFNYADRMSAEPTSFQWESPDEKFAWVLGYFPENVGFTTTPTTLNFTTSSETGNYLITGSDREETHNSVADPTIIMYLGDTISFDNTATYSNHPMYIRVSDGGASVTNPAATGEGTATVSWTPTTTGSYVYQCGSHPLMIGYIDIFDPNDDVFIGHKTIQRAIQTTSKAMLLSILDGDSKRTANVGVGTTRAKLDIFFNTLKYPAHRNYSIKPWVNWNDSVGVCTPVSIARTDNVATVTTNPAHGMSTSYDDWGVVMNLNTGIATSFNISTETAPNGVPIVITSPTSFTYRNSGINTSISNVSGTADIKVGWGGTSNNLHLYVF